jgi:heptosyltransferase III
MKKAYVFPAKGIGDALLMMIASHHLFLSGYEVTTFHSSLPELQTWFPGHRFSAENRDDLSVSFLASADLIIIENDNSPFYKKIIELRNQHTLFPISIFYPSYCASKHGLLSPLDQIFDPAVSMADNVSFSVAKLLKQPLSSKNNGLTPFPWLSHRKEKKRVLIHPTSSQKEKNWSANKYIKIASLLQKQGYQPHFTVSPQERHEWEDLLQDAFPLPYFANLSEFSAYVYESGYLIGNDSLSGHLASNLNIPTLIIANYAKRMLLWRPGWLKGEIVTPSPFIPNWKGLRLREKHWQKCISTSNVLRVFQKLARTF